MKIYYSNMSAVNGLEAFLHKKIGILDSYYALKSPKPPPYCGDYFLDSGAFSAFRQKVTISVVNYGDFLAEHADAFTVYANLDVIGDVEATIENQLALEKRGFTPLPTFHFGEPWEYLDWYCKRYPYLALGGFAKLGNKESLNRWLEIAWSRILAHKKGTIQVHGFGVQSVPLIEKYPWYSVDATSAHVIARYGGIYTPWGPFKINPKVNPRERDWMLSTPVKLERVREWAGEAFPGVDFEKARENAVEGTLLRCVINVLFFEKIAKEHRPTFSATTTSGRLLF